jgi:hypothetical protein
VILVRVVDAFVIVTLLPGRAFPNWPGGAGDAELEVGKDE